MSRQWFAGLAVLVLGAGLATATAQNDKEFFSKAAQINQAEVQLGQLAAERATHPEVKQFGQQMVQDHGRANKMLQETAGKTVAIPKELDKEHKEKAEKLSQLRGAEFDRAYMKAMVEGHRKAVEFFERQAKEAQDPQAKAYAARMLPEVRKHLEQAEQIARKLQQ